MDLLTLASKHRDWLALRQKTAAENVSNADTPGFSARRVQPFSEVLSASGQSRIMSSGHPRHIGGSVRERLALIEPEQNAAAVTHSGNSVRVEEELLEASSVKRAYALNTSIMHAFKRMITASTKA